MNQKQIAKYKKELIEKRDDLLEVVKTKKQLDMTDVEIGDEIDSASQNVEKELLFELADNEKLILDSIESALRRIEKNTFGKCESCKEKILEARVNAIPWVRYCIACQNKSEKPR